MEMRVQASFSFPSDYHIAIPSPHLALRLVLTCDALNCRLLGLPIEELRRSYDPPLCNRPFLVELGCL